MNPSSETIYPDELSYLLSPPPSVSRLPPPTIWVFPVFCDHAPETNTILSQQYLDRLEEMPVGQFLNHLLYDMALHERKSLMMSETNRRRTFLAGWPHDNTPTINRTMMAKAGFYYLGDADRVQCPICECIFSDWSAEYDPLEAHGRQDSNCYYEFIRSFDRFRETLQLDHLQMNNIRTPHLLTEDLASISSRLDISTHYCARLPGATETPAMTDARTASFNENWPERLNKAKMLEAGFKFEGSLDIVSCVQCHASFSGWDGDEDPLTEHVRWSPWCPFLIQLKGKQFVDEIHKSTPENKKLALKDHKYRYDKFQVGLDLGYSPEILKYVIHKNQGPFESFQDMLPRVRQLTESMKNVNFKKAYPLAPTHSVSTAEGVRPKIEVPVNFEYQITYQACLDQGHCKDVIERATLANGGPFNNLADMLEGVRRIEEVSSPTEDIAGLFEYSEVSSNQQPGAAGTASQRHPSQYFRPTYELACLDCERVKAEEVKADNVGLPCGHLIFCDGCAANANMIGASVARCPFFQCGAPLDGTLKVFL